MLSDYRLPMSSFHSDIIDDKTTSPNLSTVYPFPPDQTTRHTIPGRYGGLRTIDEIAMEEGTREYIEVDDGLYATLWSPVTSKLTLPEQRYNSCLALSA